jgi:serine protease inhibitor
MVPHANSVCEGNRCGVCRRLSATIRFREALVKTYRLLVAAGLVVATVGACGSTPPIPTLGADNVSRQRPAGNAPVATVAEAITGLGYRLESSAFPTGHNSVVSPLSIAYAFAMARAGAGGETAAQLDQVLGFPSTGLPDAFNAITQQVVTADIPPSRPPGPRKDGSPQPTVVCVGNGLFPQHGQPIGEQFLHTLAAQYGTGVHPVDFAAGKGSDLINQWVSQQTAGRIKKLFDALPADTKLVLANTVYLRADWAHAVFAQDAVTTQPFTRADGTSLMAPTMHGQDTLRYAAGAGWQAVDVPYAGGQLAMRIVLPAPGQAPGRLRAPATMSAVTAALHTDDVALSLPRWDFASDLDLVPALKTLGLTLPFTPAADFSAISPGLSINQAVHRANITVDEWGTEAAAVTGLTFATAGKAPPKIQMTVDRPFAFAIVHTPTGVPLFMGQVADPSAH